MNPIALHNSYVAKVLPKRIFAFHKNFGGRVGSSIFDCSKYDFVILTACCCSPRIAKFHVRLPSNLVSVRISSIAVKASESVHRNHSFLSAPSLSCKKPLCFNKRCTSLSVKQVPSARIADSLNRILKLIAAVCSCSRIRASVSFLSV